MRPASVTGSMVLKPAPLLDCFRWPWPLLDCVFGAVRDRVPEVQALIFEF